MQPAWEEVALTVAVTLSQSVTKARNPSPNRVPAILWRKQQCHGERKWPWEPGCRKGKGSERSLGVQLQGLPCADEGVPWGPRVTPPDLMDSRMVWRCSAAFRRICSRVMSAFSRSALARARASASTRSISFLCRSSISRSMVAARKGRRVQPHAAAPLQ